MEGMQAANDCTLLKSDNRFYSIFPQCRKRFKNFSPPGQAKEQKENIRNIQCGSCCCCCCFWFRFSILPSFTFPSHFACPFLRVTFHAPPPWTFLFLLISFFFLPTRDVQKLNGNQHITSGKICVNKVAGVVAHRRHRHTPPPFRFATPIRVS